MFGLGPILRATHSHGLIESLHFQPSAANRYHTLATSRSDGPVSRYRTRFKSFFEYNNGHLLQIAGRYSLVFRLLRRTHGHELWLGPGAAAVARHESA